MTAEKKRKEKKKSLKHSEKNEELPSEEQSLSWELTSHQKQSQKTMEWYVQYAEIVE